MSQPPSLNGLYQDRVTEWLFLLKTSGSSGGSGWAEGTTEVPWCMTWAIILYTKTTKSLLQAIRRKHNRFSICLTVKLCGYMPMTVRHLWAPLSFPLSALIYTANEKHSFFQPSSQTPNFTYCCDFVFMLLCPTQLKIKMTLCCPDYQGT